MTLCRIRKRAMIDPGGCRDDGTRPLSLAMRHKFTLEYWREGDWYVGRLIEVPGVFSQGKTLAEC